MKFKEITKSFKNNNKCFKVLDNININIKPAQIILINGSSGIGKTTLLNILGCLLRPDNGMLHFENKVYDLNLDDMEKFRVENYSYVFQNFNLLPEFNVYENLLIPALINKLNINDTKKQIHDILEYMNILDLKYSFPNLLSQGEKQRISFLRSLIGNQSIILADEPTGNLDEINTKIILDLIVNINKDFKKTFVIASHDNEFLKIADVVYLIKNGKLVKE